MRERRVERRRVGAETGACGVRQVGAASNGDNIRLVSKFDCVWFVAGLIVAGLYCVTAWPKKGGWVTSGCAKPHLLEGS